MRCNECDHLIAAHHHSGCVSCQAIFGDAFWCSKTDAGFTSSTGAGDGGVVSMFWMIDCPDCGGSGGGEWPNTCWGCRGTGLVKPDEDDIEAMREQEDDERWGR